MLEQLRRALGYINCHLPENKRLLEAQAEFGRGCNSLTAIVGASVEQVRSATLRVACETTHPSHIVPSHIYNLIYDRWRDEKAPDCVQGCLTKFYQYLEEGNTNA